MKDVPVLRVAAIHDLSGFGRASLTVAIPILATMGIQVCPLPTAVLSSQTGGHAKLSVKSQNMLENFSPGSLI